MSPSTSLENPPDSVTHRSEKRWAKVSLGLLVAVMITAAWTAYRLSKCSMATPPRSDCLALPDSVRREILSQLEEHLTEAQLIEQRDGDHCEFLIRGQSKAVLAQDFHRRFRPFVADRLMPMLRPYGDAIRFEVASLDLPPVRLRTVSESKE